MNYKMIKSIKKIALSLLVIFGCVLSSSAQKEPQYTQYMYNIGSFNPAYVGTTETVEITGLYRAQWLDIEGAPRTIRAGANFPLGNEVNGLGLNIVNDQLGPVTQTYVDGAYSFQFRVSDGAKLSFGVDAGGSFLNLDFSKGTFENPGEPILDKQSVSKFYFTVGAGAFLYGNNWYLGASVPNFLNDGVYDDEIAGIVEDKIQYNFIGGYVFNLSDNLRFKPAFLINMLKGAPLNVNASANFLIKNTITAGVSYRFDNAFSGLLGVQISDAVFAGLSYDYVTNSLGKYNNGTPEFIMKFKLGASRSGNKANKANKKNAKGKPKQVDTPRFF